MRRLLQGGALIIMMLLAVCHAKEVTKLRQTPKKCYCRCPGGARLRSCGQTKQNFIVNGDAELPISSQQKGSSWKVGYGRLYVAVYDPGRLCYNAPLNFDYCDIPTGNDAHGTRFFAGTCGKDNTTIFQDIHVGCFSKQIDKHQVVANFQGLFGGCNNYLGAAHAVIGFYNQYPRNKRPHPPARHDWTRHDVPTEGPKHTPQEGNSYTGAQGNQMDSYHGTNH